ncbi:circularly permutated Ras protein 1-like isoform X3 [Alosa sapidissima]|uniref:circularly permutated Ras protein 1-like isoform X3 n=1 Tax=Alosa sapidissima TaxID=34773 RepID=UPI001C0A4122|nr:circularly permutated Ras protein 1-like isoform X3 [Alosa sapidissima]
MEFACKHVYVPPPIEKPKRSALLPPVKKVRPRTPPPPPPTPLKELVGPLSPSSASPNTLQVDQPPPHLRPRSAPPSPRLRSSPSSPPAVEPRVSPGLAKGQQVQEERYCSVLPGHEVDQTRRFSSPEHPRTHPLIGPPLPPRPAFLTKFPVNTEVFPSTSPLSPNSEGPPRTPCPFPPSGPTDKQPLPGNPNVILIDLDKIVTDTNNRFIDGEPPACPACGSVLDTCYDNVVQETDGLVYKSRLEFVQEALLQCVRDLSRTEHNTRVALVSFNNEVTMHGHTNVISWRIGGDDLIEGEFLKNAGLTFPTPPPISEAWDGFQAEIYGLQEGGATALGPAAAVAIGMASQIPGSKVLICTDGRANTDLGDLEAEDKDSCTLVSSSIFYKDLGEYAASKGVTVSVMSFEGTDCRLDELGRLADCTGGEVVISSPEKLYSAFHRVIENRTKATHCTVTLLLPTTLCVKGEREMGHCVVRQVGNVMPHTELTLQFGLRDQKEHSQVLLSTGSVCIQLQVKYRMRDGLRMLRVITMHKEVTSNSSLVLSSVSLSVLHLNSVQNSAALAVRGRLRDAQKEQETQAELIQRAVEFQQNSGYELIYPEWVKAMNPLNNIYNYTRGNPVSSLNSKSLTDKGAALLFGLKHGNRMSITPRGRDRTLSDQ